MRRAALLLAVALAAPALAQDPPPPAGGSALERRLRDELSIRPYLKSGWVEVRVVEHDVTLTGKTPDELHRALVQLICENDPDVGKVSNRISVDESLIPWRPSKEDQDRIVARNARCALRADRRLGRFTSLDAKVERGTARIVGKVEREEQKRAAERIVKEIEGVERVESSVEVQPEGAARQSGPPLEPTSAESDLAKAIVKRVTSDALLRGAVAVTPVVTGEQVALLGNAPDLPRHDYAVELARSEILRDLTPARRDRSPFRSKSRDAAPTDPASRARVTLASLIVIGRRTPPKERESPAEGEKGPAGPGGRD